MGKQGEYAKIVGEVKASFAGKGRPYAGDEVTHEIARRWAKRQGRKAPDGKPKAPTGVPTSTEAPTATPEAGDEGVRERKPGQPRKIKLPDDER